MHAIGKIPGPRAQRRLLLILAAFQRSNGARNANCIARETGSYRGQAHWYLHHLRDGGLVEKLPAGTHGWVWRATPAGLAVDCSALADAAQAAGSAVDARAAPLLDASALCAALGMHAPRVPAGARRVTRL